MEKKKAMLRYSLPPGGEFPFFNSYVVSLPDATERRQSAAAEMNRVGMTRWEFADALNGSEPLPMDEVRWYTREKKLRAVENGNTKTRRHIAALISHLRLMHKMVAEGREVQMVFEDDFALQGDDKDDFVEKLRFTMQNLPEDWDVLWLNHGPPIQNDENTLLGWVGFGVQLMSHNYVSLGLVYTKQFALKALNEAQMGRSHFDIAADNLGRFFSANAYVAVPPLVVSNPNNFKSMTEIQGISKVEDSEGDYNASGGVEGNGQAGQGVGGGTQKRHKVKKFMD